MNLRNPILSAALLAALVPACSKAGDGSKSSVDKSAFKVFSADSDFIGGVNGAELRKSKYFGEIQKKLPADALGMLAKFKECGVDVLGGLSSAVVAGNSSSKKGMVKVNGFYRNEFKMCDGVEGITITVDVEANVHPANMGQLERCRESLPGVDLPARIPVVNRGVLARVGIAALVVANIKMFRVGGVDAAKHHP